MGEEVALGMEKCGYNSSPPQGDDCNALGCPRESSKSLTPDAMDVGLADKKAGEQSLRDVYKYSCHEFGIRPNEDILQQLSPVAGEEWTSQMKVLDFTAVYLGGKGCLPLVPVIQRCTEVTHLIMPNIGLTHEAAAPLLEVMRSHPSMTWMDLSKNRLNDDVGRWILTAILENPNIRFVLLRDAGISPPLVQKIENHLQGRMHKVAVTPGVATLSIRVTDADGISELFESSVGTGCCNTAVVPPHYVPSSVAAGLVELRRQLHRNAESMQCVYDCFTRNLSPDLGVCENGVVVDRNDSGEPRGKDAVVHSHNDRCSWRSFFCGLRLLGVRAVCRNLSDSVAFANVCGICDIESISFGKLVQLLRPHVAIRDETSPEAPPLCGGTIARRFPDDSLLLETGEQISAAEASTPSASASDDVRSLVTGEKDPPASPALLSIEMERSTLMVKPLHCTLQERMSTFGSSPADTFAATPSVIVGGCATGPLEARLRLDRAFDSRNKQTVVDRLYDARPVLRQAFKKNIVKDLGGGVSASLVDLEEVIERAVSHVGERNRNIVASLVEPWVVAADERLLVNTDGWLRSMYIPQLEASTLAPLSFTEEKHVWRGTRVEELREVVGWW